jgi:hypothetical protein
MTKQELPQCSMEGCSNAAGVILDGALFCGEHANEALERWRGSLPQSDSEEDPEQP